MQYDWYPYKKRRRNTETDTQGEYHVTMEAEVGVMLLQDKECQVLLAVTRS